MKCQLCNKPATVHLTEIVSGEKTERHLCEECAQKEQIYIKAQPAISELLTNLVAAQHEAREMGDHCCPQCNLNWSEFRRTGMLGCPNDYVVFEKMLKPLIERAHEGALTHMGRVPKGEGGRLDRQVKLLRLRRDLQRMLDQEDYEAAARIRDEIHNIGSN